MLGKLPVPGRPTILITVGQGPTALAVGAGWGCLDIFTLIYPFSSLSPSLWETARYRLKYCLKGPLNPKQPTNQLPLLKKQKEKGKYVSRRGIKPRTPNLRVRCPTDGTTPQAGKSCCSVSPWHGVSISIGVHAYMFESNSRDQMTK